MIHGNNDEWFDAISNMKDEFTSFTFDECGNYHKWHINSSHLRNQDF